MNSYKYADIEVGKSESFSVMITEKMLESFKNITGDVNPLHNDEEYAIKNNYSGRVAYGMLTASFMSTLAGVYIPGKYSLIQGAEEKFAAPVYIGDKITVTGEVTEKNDTYSLIFLKVTMKNQKGEKVCRGRMQIGVTE